MSITGHKGELEKDWDLVTVALGPKSNLKEDRTLMYASHRNCGWVPPQNNSDEPRCSECGAKLNEKAHRMIRVHNFVMKIGV